MWLHPLHSTPYPAASFSTLRCMPLKMCDPLWRMMSAACVTECHTSRLFLGLAARNGPLHRLLNFTCDSLGNGVQVRCKAQSSVQPSQCTQRSQHWPATAIHQDVHGNALMLNTEWPAECTAASREMRTSVIDWVVARIQHEESAHH